MDITADVNRGMRSNAGNVILKTIHVPHLTIVVRVIVSVIHTRLIQYDKHVLSLQHVQRLQQAVITI
jgi:hypothetical protein